VLVFIETPFLYWCNEINRRFLKALPKLAVNLVKENIKKVALSPEVMSIPAKIANPMV